jgi:hypothetical protein
MAIGTSGKGLGGVLLVIRITGVSKEAGDGPTKKLGDTVDQDINAWSYKFSTTLGCQYQSFYPTLSCAKVFGAIFLAAKPQFGRVTTGVRMGPRDQVC